MTASEQEALRQFLEGGERITDMLIRQNEQMEELKVEVESLQRELSQITKLYGEHKWRDEY